MSFPYKIRNNLFFSILQILIGGFILIVALLILDNPVQLFMGIFFIVFGIIRLTSPVVLITEAEIQLKNGFGMTMKRIPYTLDSINVKGNKVFVAGKRIFTAFLLTVHFPDFKVFSDYVEANNEPDITNHLIEE